jgi:hypothetical protein
VNLGEFWGHLDRVEVKERNAGVKLGLKFGIERIWGILRKLKIRADVKI